MEHIGATLELIAVSNPSEKLYSPKLRKGFGLIKERSRANINVNHLHTTSRPENVGLPTYNQQSV